MISLVALPVCAVALSFSLISVDESSENCDIAPEEDCLFQRPAGCAGCAECLSQRDCSRRAAWTRLKGRPRWRERVCAAIRRGASLKVYSSVV
ncbi:MAG: hypothetical protein LBJ89_04105 [Holosporales bacterium]|jgi:hypothetical protein|nr:hypothetical protein [Holosporales bacterium]